MSDTSRGFDVWLQGGPGDGTRATTSYEPPSTIVYLPHSPHPYEYVRVPDVEQFDHERIYYPKGPVSVDVLCEVPR